MSNFGFVADVLFLSVTFFLIVLFRERLSRLFTYVRLPKLVLFVVSSIPFIIVEENVNCLPSGCVLVPFTVPLLIFYVLVWGVIICRFRIKSWKYPLVGFVVFGILWEMVIGGLRGRLLVLGVGFYSFMVFWVGVSYAYLIVVPLRIWYQKK